MKKTILGIDQKRAVALGIDLVDAVLISTIADKRKSKKSEKCEIDGDVYVWVNYKSIIEWLPILGIKKRALAIRLDRLVEKGFLKKHIKKEEGNYTFFALCHSDSKPVSTKVQRVCHSTDNPLSLELQTKSNRDKDTEIREKEKDITKVISKKKDGDFDNEVEKFKNHVDADPEFAYSLRHYHIKSVATLVDRFKLHILNNGLVGEFMRNGYQRNKGWLLRVIPKLDVSDITGVTLGKGEYLKNGRRYYLNPRGKEVEVPMDAPPRQLKSQIWYGDHWGEDV
jgi:hypothetical protein